MNNGYKGGGNKKGNKDKDVDKDRGGKWVKGIKGSKERNEYRTFTFNW